MCGILYVCTWAPACFLVRQATLGTASHLFTASQVDGVIQPPGSPELVRPWMCLGSSVRRWFMVHGGESMLNDGLYSSLMINNSDNPYQLATLSKIEHTSTSPVSQFMIIQSRQTPAKTKSRTWRLKQDGFKDSRTPKSQGGPTDQVFVMRWSQTDPTN